MCWLQIISWEFASLFIFNQTKTKILQHQVNNKGTEDSSNRIGTCGHKFPRNSKEIEVYCIRPKESGRNYCPAGKGRSWTITDQGMAEDLAEGYLCISCMMQDK